MTALKVPEAASHQGIDVSIVAENRLVREALGKLLQKEKDIHLLFADGFGPQIVNQIVNARPRVVILDPTGMSEPCTRVIAESIRAAPGLRIVVIGMDADPLVFLRYVRAGIAGYLLRDASAADVLAAVRSTSSEKAVCPAELCRALFDWVARQEIPLSSLNGKLHLGLSRRELEILQILSYGYTNKEVAAQLNLCEQTVKNHVHRLLHKLGASNRSAALEFFYLQGLNGTSAETARQTKPQIDPGIAPEKTPRPANPYEN